MFKQSLKWELVTSKIRSVNYYLRKCCCSFLYTLGLSLIDTSSTPSSKLWLLKLSPGILRQGRIGRISFSVETPSLKCIFRSRDMAQSLKVRFPILKARSMCLCSSQSLLERLCIRQGQKIIHCWCQCSNGDTNSKCSCRDGDTQWEAERSLYTFWSPRKYSKAERTLFPWHVINIVI